ncbi:uncharacterized protein LOC129731766 [Wyeomyia smithii]|uniref:uncharacterized protein LOC129731766 n=1 Tax=Wyeomyia smithii TaxID=174621 RepID=UPI002467DA07|nr:uncharacterized protein LOC129731766 [Wyeomyia smithii]
MHRLAPGKTSSIKVGSCDYSTLGRRFISIPRRKKQTKKNALLSFTQKATCSSRAMSTTPMDVDFLSISFNVPLPNRKEVAAALKVINKHSRVQNLQPSTNWLFPSFLVYAYPIRPAS